MRKFKARSGGVGAASPGARERVSRSRIPLRLTRNRVATCRLEPSRFSLVCTNPETAITCGGSQRQLRAGRLPLRLSRGACQRQPLSEHPEARPRPPSPCPTVAPGGTWRRHGQAAHLVCVTLPGVQASHGQPQSSEEVEPCRD